MEEYSENQLEQSLRCIEKSRRLREEGYLEDVLRHNLSSYLRHLFPDSPKWVELHIEGSEALVHFSRDTSQHRGFVDSLIGGTAIEYESDLRKTVKFSTGLNQVKEYCAGLLNAGYAPENIRGILSDTVLWFAYNIRVENERTAEYRGSDLELIEIEKLDCDRNNQSHILLLDFLNRHLGRIGSRLLDAESINKDLGFNSNLSQDFLPRITSALDNLSTSNPEYASLIQNVWGKFVNSVRDNRHQENFDSAFYVDEFYLTTIAKCICANVLCEKALVSNREEAHSILDGSFFRLRGYQNIVEYDFFGWLNHSPVHASILELVTQIQLDLRAYDYKTVVSEDMFSKLFSELANKTRRILLGQEMTPQWLVKLIVEKVLDSIEEAPRLIDMCCGSGTFIVETNRILMNRMGDAPQEEKLETLLTSITGFDIDPLAVILAKVNWVIVAKPFLNNTSLTNITIPIFNADSLFAVTPVSTRKNSDTHFVLNLLEHEVRMPKVLINKDNKTLFEKILDTGYSLIQELPSVPDERAYHQNLVQGMNPSPSLTAKDISDIIDFTKDFYIIVHNLHSEGKNGIWNFLLQNSYRPGLVENTFNGLVSNPPWLTLSKVAENPYKVFLQELADEMNIKPTGSSFLHTELATIFLLHSIEKYLCEDAKIGCVLPGTILSGDHHHPFRTSSYSSSNLKFKIEEIWDLHKSTFNNRGVVVFGSRTVGPNLNPIAGLTSVTSHSSTPTSHYLSTIDTKSAWSEYNVTRSLEESYVNEFTQGADIMPRTLYFHELRENNGVYTASPIDTETSNFSYLIRSSKKFPEFRIEPSTIEAEVIFPVILSNCLLPFISSQPPLAILPIEKDEQEWTPILPERLISMSTGLRRLVSRSSQLYGSESDIVTLWSNLNERSKLSNQSIPSEGFIVISGTSGQYVCAAYLNTSQVDFQRVVIDQTVNYYVVENEEEAIFLVGVLNSKITSKVIRSFQAVGNFGARHIHSLPYRIIPKYDSSNLVHLGVVDATSNVISELNTFLNGSTERRIQRLKNPNESNIQHKRMAIRGIVDNLSSYANYEIACGTLFI